MFEKQLSGKQIKIPTALKLTAPLNCFPSNIKFLEWMEVALK